MTNLEFSRQFDVRFNNIDSNLAHSVTEYEKSLYLTQAQLELVKNYFNPNGNKYKEGFDGSPKRDVDFSSIIKVKAIGSGTKADGSAADYTGNPSYTDGFGIVGLSLIIDDNVLFLLNERFLFNGSQDATTVYALDTTVVPIDYKHYQTILGKAYKDPPIRQTWRMIRGGATDGNITVELIPKSTFDTAKPYLYYTRYIMTPEPIVLENLPGDLSINGVATATECKLSPMLHEEILARAVEICKNDFLGDLNSTIEINKRSE